MKKVLLAAAVLAAFAAGAVQAQVPPDRSVKYRQSALTQDFAARWFGQSRRPYCVQQE